MVAHKYANRVTVWTLPKHKYWITGKLLFVRDGHKYEFRQIDYNITISHTHTRTDTRAHTQD